MRDLPGDAPSAFSFPPDFGFGPSPTPLQTAFSGGTIGDPLRGPAGVWPASVLWTAPTGEEENDVFGVDRDGTIYTHATVYATDSYEAIRAFRRDGAFSPGWPEGGVHLKGLIVDAILGSDGATYIAMEQSIKDVPTESSPRATTITAIDAAGRVEHGWPYTMPASVFHGGGRFEFGHVLLARPGGGICFVQQVAVDFSTPPTTDLVCLGPDGQPAPGWPLRSSSILGSPAIGPDGSVYFVERVGATSLSQTATLAALGPDGHPRPGWAGPSVPASAGDQVVVGLDGGVFALVGSYPARLSIAAFASDGTPDELFDRNVAVALGPPGPQVFLQGMVLGPGGTLYLALNVIDGPDHSRLLAIAPDGTSRSGWPFDGGTFLLVAFPSPDGSVWLWMGTAGATTPRLVILGRDGTVQPGWPVLGVRSMHAMAFDADGRAFFVSRPDGVDYLETIDPRHP